MEASEFLKKVKHIELLSLKILKDGLGGLYKASFKGSGMQFREFRDYVYGDDLRSVSWLNSAKRDKTIVKLFEEERDRSVVLMVDVSASLKRGALAQMKAERLAEIAGAIAFSASHAGDMVSLILFSDRVEKFIPPKKGKNHLLRVLREILGAQAEGSLTQPDFAFRQLIQSFKKRAIVFYLSDFEVLPSPALMKKAAQKNDFCTIGVKSAQEAYFPGGGFWAVQGAESLKMSYLLPKLRNKKLSKIYLEREEKVKNYFKKTGTDLLSIDLEEDFVLPIQNYFRKRARRR